MANTVLSLRQKLSLFCSRHGPCSATDTVKLPSEKFAPKQEGGPIEVQGERKHFVLTSAEELYAAIRLVRRENGIRGQPVPPESYSVPK